MHLPLPTLTALEHRNYRMWFFGQLVSIFGSWMQITALSFLVYQLTSSVYYSGLVGFASGISTWLFMIFGGIASDRMSRRSVLIITQIIMMVLALTLAGLTFMGIVQMWQIIVIAVLGGVANAFDAPARHSFVPEMVPKSSLENAFALNSVMLSLAIALGPALAGIIFATLGPAWCFLINALSFLAVLAALLMMRKLRFHTIPPTNIRQDFVEMFRFIADHQIILSCLMIAAYVSAINSAINTITPAWSAQILQGDATTNGLLQSAKGFGALIVALALTTYTANAYRGRIILVGLLYVPLALVSFAVSRQLLISVLLIAAVGFLMNAISHNNYVLLASHLTDRVRGRVMSLYTLVMFGISPLIALLIGWMGQRYGLPNTVIVMTLILTVGVYVFWLSHKNLRRLG
jgi:MFS family permease